MSVQGRPEQETLAVTPCARAVGRRRMGRGALAMTQRASGRICHTARCVSPLHVEPQQLGASPPRAQGRLRGARRDALDTQRTGLAAGLPASSCSVHSALGRRSSSQRPALGRWPCARGGRSGVVARPLHQSGAPARGAAARPGLAWHAGQRLAVPALPARITQHQCHPSVLGTVPPPSAVLRTVQSRVCEQHLMQAHQVGAARIVAEGNTTR